MFEVGSAITFPGGYRYRVDRIIYGGFAAVVLLTRKYPIASSDYFFPLRLAIKLFLDPKTNAPCPHPPLEKELNTWISLQLPNSVPLLQIQKFNGVLAGCMPRYACSLKDAVAARGTLTPLQAIGCVHAVAECLHAAWSRYRLLHLDVKPHNILMDLPCNDYRHLYRLGDWGLAATKRPLMMKIAGVRLPIQQYAQFAPFAGTLPYMAPERLIADTQCDIRADIFGLGMTMFESLVGSLPFGPDAPVQLQLINEEYYSIAIAILHELKMPWLEEFVLRCIHPKAASRIADYQYIINFCRNMMEG